ncbi:MAG: hypothetical protein DI613_08570 [Kocuria rhizophila]|nr:MAG: hypothetical protein DI613_08570 [Kocuria rhizophila]
MWSVHHGHGAAPRTSRDVGTGGHSHDRGPRQLTPRTAGVVASQRPGGSGPFPGQFVRHGFQPVGRGPGHRRLAGGRTRSGQRCRDPVVGRARGAFRNGSPRVTTSASTLNHESSSRDEHGTFKALLVVAGCVVAALHVWKLSPALGTLSEQLNMSLGQAGVLVAVIQVAGMVLGMIVGLFNDSIGLRRGCLWGFGFLAVGSVLGAMARGPGLLLASRVLEGVGFLVVCVASPALIRRLVPPRRLAPIVGLWGCFFPVAAAISQLTGGFLVDTIGWRAWWLGAAALAVAVGVAVGVAVAAVIPPDASTAPRRGNDGGPRAASSSVAATSTTDTLPPAARSVGVRAKATLSTGPLWAAALVMGCYTAQWNGVIQFLPTIYAEAGIAAGAAGALSAGAAACNALGNLSAGQALGRGVKPVTLWTIGFVTMAVCAVIAFGIAPLIAEE